MGPTRNILGTTRGFFQ